MSSDLQLVFLCNGNPGIPEVEQRVESHPYKTGATAILIIIDARYHDFNGFPVVLVLKTVESWQRTSIILRLAVRQILGCCRCVCLDVCMYVRICVHVCLCAYTWRVILSQGTQGMYVQGMYVCMRVWTCGQRDRGTGPRIEI